MYSVEDLILKILKHKSSGEIDEINNRIISNVKNIRNYLIKIAIIRICNQKAIQYQIEDMNKLFTIYFI